MNGLHVAEIYASEIFVFPYIFVFVIFLKWEIVFKIKNIFV